MSDVDFSLIHTMLDRIQDQNATIIANQQKMMMQLTQLCSSARIADPIKIRRMLEQLQQVNTREALQHGGI